MDPDSFKDFAKDMAEYITNYLENIRDRWVIIASRRDREYDSRDDESMPDNSLRRLFL